MYVYAQHGYGKGNMIEEGLREGHIKGVILSPRHETPDNIEQYIADLRDEFGNEVTILFDPQFYVTLKMAGYTSIRIISRVSRGLTLFRRMIFGNMRRVSCLTRVN